MSADEDNGMARLVDGRADSEGAWAYGRLEVLADGVWSVLWTEPLRFNVLGRLGVQVACRSLGFDTGAQLLVGEASPFPAPPGLLGLVVEIKCVGSEASLAECEIVLEEGGEGAFHSTTVQPYSMAVMCANPPGVSFGCRALQFRHMIFCVSVHTSA